MNQMAQDCSNVFDISQEGVKSEGQTMSPGSVFCPFPEERMLWENGGTMATSHVLPRLLKKQHCLNWTVKPTCHRDNHVYLGPLARLWICLQP
ncbi:hypothetical protein UPYG_G00156080 [Umbra pygmaea]|uniref:Uncharacterized protein n=1 Tax=Umbra pygmaea TaxID=75934 RepID=A0ABD0X2B9_UMBPY